MFSFGGTKKKAAAGEDTTLVHAMLVMGLQNSVRAAVRAAVSARESRIRGEEPPPHGEELVDAVPEVQELLEILELCLWHGLREHHDDRARGASAGPRGSGGRGSGHFWDFVLLLERVDPAAFGATIMLVRANSTCATKDGLCRAWIRMLLNQNALEFTIRALCRLASTSGSDFYEDWAFLRWSVETNRTMFFTLLSLLNNVGFALDVRTDDLDRPCTRGPGDRVTADALVCGAAVKSALATACAASPDDPPTILVASSTDPESTGRYVYSSTGVYTNKVTGFQLRVASPGKSWGIFPPAQDLVRYSAPSISSAEPPLQGWTIAQDEDATTATGKPQKPPQLVRMLHSQSIRARLYPGSAKLKWTTLVRSEVQAIRVEIKQTQAIRDRLDHVRKLPCPDQDFANVPSSAENAAQGDDGAKDDHEDDVDDREDRAAEDSGGYEAGAKDVPRDDLADAQAAAETVSAGDMAAEDDAAGDTVAAVMAAEVDVAVKRTGHAAENRVGDAASSDGTPPNDAAPPNESPRTTSSEDMASASLVAESSAPSSTVSNIDSTNPDQLVDAAKIVEPLPAAAVAESTASSSIDGEIHDSLADEFVQEPRASEADDHAGVTGANNAIVRENSSEDGLAADIELPGDLSASDVSRPAGSAQDVDNVDMRERKDEKPDDEVIASPSLVDDTGEERLHGENNAPSEHDDDAAEAADAGAQDPNEGDTATEEDDPSLRDNTVQGASGEKRPLQGEETQLLRTGRQANSMDASRNQNSPLAKKELLASAEEGSEPGQERSGLEECESGARTDDVLPSAADRVLEVEESAGPDEREFAGEMANQTDERDEVGPKEAGEISDAEPRRIHESKRSDGFESLSDEEPKPVVDTDSSCEVVPIATAQEESPSRQSRGRRAPVRVKLASIDDGDDLDKAPLDALETSSETSRRPISRPLVVHTSQIAAATAAVPSPMSAIQRDSTLLANTSHIVMAESGDSSDEDDKDDDDDEEEEEGEEVDETEEERLARYAREEEASLAEFIAEMEAKKADAAEQAKKAEDAGTPIADKAAASRDGSAKPSSRVPKQDYAELVRAYVRQDPRSPDGRRLASEINAVTGYEIGPMEPASAKSQTMEMGVQEGGRENADEHASGEEQASRESDGTQRETESGSEGGFFSLSVLPGRLSLWGSASGESDTNAQDGSAENDFDHGTEDVADVDPNIDIDLASDDNVTRVESAAVVGHYICKQASDTHVRFIIRVQLRKIARAGDEGLGDWAPDNDASIVQNDEVDSDATSSRPVARTATFTIHRRFRAFKQFRASLIAAASAADSDADFIPALPKTAWTRTFAEDYITKKRNALDKFMQDTLRLEIAGASAREHATVVAFLTRGTQVPWEFEDGQDEEAEHLTGPWLAQSRTRQKFAASRGLHISLVTDPRGDPDVLEARDGAGLAEQDFRCISCGKDISIALGRTSGLLRTNRGPARRSARFCHYTERWFCPHCYFWGSQKGNNGRRHGNGQGDGIEAEEDGDNDVVDDDDDDTGLDCDEDDAADPNGVPEGTSAREHRRGLPTRILHHWDFETYSVSADAAAFLDSVAQHPVLCVSAVSPLLFSHVKELQHARLLRLQLVHAREALSSCPNAQGSLNQVAPALRSRDHLAEETEMYSVDDLFKLKIGSLIPLLMLAVEQVAEHITRTCERCRGTAQVCAICNRTDDPLFAFQIDTSVQCRGCQQVFHRVCFSSAGGEDFCPVCNPQGADGVSNTEATS